MTNLEQQYDDLLFGVRRSIRYHRRRQGFFESCHTWTMAIMVLSGSATIAVFASSLNNAWPMWMQLTPSVLVTVFATFDLVIGFTRRALLYADLARRFGDLEQRMEAERTNPTDEALGKLTVQRLGIEMAEPPVLRVLDTICHNDLMRAMGYKSDSEEYRKVNFLQWLFAHVFDFRQHRLTS